MPGFDLDKIERLHALKQKGLLSEEEFAREKARLLSEDAPARFSHTSTNPEPPPLPYEQSLQPDEDWNEEVKPDRFKTISLSIAGVVSLSAAVLGMIYMSSGSVVPNGNPPDKVVKRKENPDPVGQSKQGQPILGRCHMGYCSWSIEQSRKVLRAENGGELISLSLIGGESHHSDGNYEADQPIRWNTSAHTLYVHCSKTLPAVMMETDGELQTDVIDLTVPPPGVLQSSYELYVATCHGRNTNWNSEGFAKRNGYTSPPAIDSATIKRPLDIFAVAQQASLPKRESRLTALSEELLADPSAAYGYTCRADDLNGQLLFFTTDISSSNQTSDGTASFGGRMLKLDGDRNMTPHNSMRLRDGSVTLLLEGPPGGLTIDEDDPEGIMAQGKGNLTVMGSGEPVIAPVQITCLQL